MRCLKVSILIYSNSNSRIHHDTANHKEVAIYEIDVISMSLFNHAVLL